MLPEPQFALLFRQWFFGRRGHCIPPQPLRAALSGLFLERNLTQINVVPASSCFPIIATVSVVRAVASSLLRLLTKLKTARLGGLFSSVLLGSVLALGSAIIILAAVPRAYLFPEQIGGRRPLIGLVFSLQLLRFSGAADD